MLIPGISSDLVVSRILLTLSGRYRCLAKLEEITPGQARQEVLANTHLQIREIDAYIKAFLADLSTRATSGSLSSPFNPAAWPPTSSRISARQPTRCWATT